MLYCPDHTNENDKDDPASLLVDFRGSRYLPDEFPGTGIIHEETPDSTPYYALDSGVRRVSWRPGSMRVVILIGDTGNEQPDKRGFTIDGVVKTLQEHHCEFFAIQTQPHGTGDARVALFNS